mgnify:FL=1
MGVGWVLRLPDWKRTSQLLPSLQSWTRVRTFRPHVADLGRLSCLLQPPLLDAGEATFAVDLVLPLEVGRPTVVPKRDSTIPP